MDDLLEQIIKERIAYWAQEPRDESMGATVRVMELRHILETLLPERREPGAK